MFGKRKKHAVLPVPADCVEYEIKAESSVCTGEKTIGFYNPSTRELEHAELVRNDNDIAEFYAKYGLKRE